MTTATPNQSAIGVVAVILIAATCALALTETDAADAILIPGAAHVTGANNTVWRTDLEVRSVSSIPAQIRIDLLRKNQDNTNHPSVIVNIDGFAAQRFGDVVDQLFGFEGSATLRLVTLAGEIRATSRTYNLTQDGTFGQFIGGSGPDDEFEFQHDATLIQLTSSPDFRTNIGLVNLVDFPVNMEIDLYRADLVYYGRIEKRLQPHEFKQIDDAYGQVTGAVVDDGFAIVRTTTFGSGFLTYASVIDNRTGDPIYIPGLDAGSDLESTPTPTPTAGSSTPTPTPTPTPTSTPNFIDPVVVTTLDEETINLVPASIVFRVGNGSQTSLILCGFDGTISQVASSNFSYIQGPTETVAWPNCCASFGARLEYETILGIGAPAVARSTCTTGTPYFAITGTEVETGELRVIDGVDLDIAIWP